MDHTEVQGRACRCVVIQDSKMISFEADHTPTSRQPAPGPHGRESENLLAVLEVILD